MRSNGRLKFCKRQALQHCPFRGNVYREMVAAHEALGLGLIRREDQKSPELNIPTLRQIEEIHEVRLLFETEVCRRVADYSSRGSANRDKVLNAIHPIHTEMIHLGEKAVQQGNEADRVRLAEDLWDLDVKFHETLATLSGWPLFGLAVRIIRDRLWFVSTPDLQIIERAPTVIKEHEAILLAVTARRVDSNAVEKTVDAHLLSTLQFLEDEIRKRDEGLLDHAYREGQSRAF